MKASEKYLIEFWIETKMVRRDRRVPGDPASKNVYFFDHELVGDLELVCVHGRNFLGCSITLTTYLAFLKELESEIVENPFDPWRNPRFVGISIRIPPHNRQDYQLVEVFTQ